MLDLEDCRRRFRVHLERIEAQENGHQPGEPDYASALGCAEGYILSLEEALKVALNAREQAVNRSAFEDWAGA